MSSIQPLFDVKERLEYAAVAGTGLMGEDFRLQRAAESLKPLAAASPVFGKISAGLTRLLEAPAEERAGCLLDVLALVDAVAYTQGTYGLEGELAEAPTGSGTYQQIPYGQMQPLLAALTSTGGGRMEVIQSTWEAHPEYFSDFRILPKVVEGLGDSYGEIANLNAGILQELGPAVLPLLREGFDPAGNRAMVRRVEVIAAIQGPEAGPWLRALLPEAKKDVRPAVIAALGGERDNTPLLLELAKTERGKNRDAALQSLAFQEGEAVRAFWERELEENSASVKFLRDTREAWAAGLVAAGLRRRLEACLSGEKQPTQAEHEDIVSWCYAIGCKDSPAMLDFWRWADSRMEDLDALSGGKDKPLLLGVRLTDCQRDILLKTGPGPLRDFCLDLWDRRPTMNRYLITSFLAAMLERPPEEVYGRFSPYLLTEKPAGADAPRRNSLHDVLLRAFTWVVWRKDRGCYWVQDGNHPFYNREGAADLLSGQPAAGPLDRRWIPLMVRAFRREISGQYMPFGGGDPVGRFDLTFVSLIDQGDPDMCATAAAYLRGRMLETGNALVYGRFLLDLGVSPKGALGRAMQKKPGRHYAYHTWELLSAASRTLPPEEVAELLEEAGPANLYRKNDAALMEKAVPVTAAALRAGKPFPEWNEWWSMR